MPKPNEKRLRRICRARTRSRSSSSYSPSGLSMPISKSSSSPIRSAWLCEQARLQRSARAKSPGRQVAARTGGRTDQRHQAQSWQGRRRSRKVKLFEGGKTGDRRFAGSDDRAGQARRSRGRGPSARSCENEVEEPKRQAYDKIAKAKFAVEGDQHLSRRDLHLAAGVRDGQGLRGGRQKGAVPDDLRRASMRRPKQQNNRFRSICRSAGSTARTS